MWTATLSSTFQISIPKEVLEKQAWRPGQKFAFIVTERGVLLTPIPERDALAGIARGANVENYRDRDDRY